MGTAAECDRDGKRRTATLRDVFGDGECDGTAALPPNRDHRGLMLAVLAGMAPTYAGTVVTPAYVAPTYATPDLVVAATDSISFAHWNPHWQCFTGHPSCAANTTAALSNLLSATGLDFANVVELEAASFTPPPGYAAIAPIQSCGDDWDTLFYNTKRWTRLVERSGCMFDDRSFAAGVFQSRRDPSLVLTVIGAHYPQTLDASTHAYAQASANLSGVLRQLGANRTVLLADTNTEGPDAAAASASHNGVNRTNAQILADLGLRPAASATAPPAAPLFRGCCYSDGFSWQGDRIIANFGSVAASRTLFDPAPGWAAFAGSEFHKGVSLTLRLQ